MKTVKLWSVNKHEHKLNILVLEFLRSLSSVQLVVREVINELATLSTHAHSPLQKFEFVTFPYDSFILLNIVTLKCAALGQAANFMKCVPGRDNGAVKTGK